MPGDERRRDDHPLPGLRIDVDGFGSGRVAAHLSLRRRARRPCVLHADAGPGGPVARPCAAAERASGGVWLFCVDRWSTWTTDTDRVREEAR
jgi:hypothetical protein